MTWEIRIERDARESQMMQLRRTVCISHWHENSQRHSDLVIPSVARDLLFASVCHPRFDRGSRVFAFFMRGFAPARRGPFVSAKGPKTIGARAWPFGCLCPSPDCLGCGTRFAQTVLASKTISGPGHSHARRRRELAFAFLLIIIDSLRKILNYFFGCPIAPRAVLAGELSISLLMMNFESP